MQQVEAGDGGGRGAAPLGARHAPPRAARAGAALVAGAPAAVCVQVHALHVYIHRETRGFIRVRLPVISPQ